MIMHSISMKTGNMLFEMENGFVFYLMYHKLIRSAENSFRCLVHHVCYAFNQFDKSRLGGFDIQFSIQWWFQQLSTASCMMQFSTNHRVSLSIKWMSWVRTLMYWITTWFWSALFVRMFSWLCSIHKRLINWTRQLAWMWIVSPIFWSFVLCYDISWSFRSWEKRRIEIWLEILNERAHYCLLSLDHSTKLVRIEECTELQIGLIEEMLQTSLSWRTATVKSITTMFWIALEGILRLINVIWDEFHCMRVVGSLSNRASWYE
jgi:hypothetical protein